MSQSPPNTLSGNELSLIRDAVPALDLLAIRSLRRAGFKIVRDTPETEITAEKDRPNQDRRWGGADTVSTAA
ncbi:hypothetical protein [Lichenicoccus sp.]|uniref:hypothetical protein n=1 Tax=Lichenicoccus sp. TaxID=2781899 RepID=UPI003D0EE3CB